MYKNVLEVRNEWVDLMMQMQENNLGVEKLTTEKYFKILKLLNSDISKLDTKIVPFQIKKKNSKTIYQIQNI